MSKHKKNKKRFPVFLYVVLGLIVIWLAGGFFIFFQEGQKQGQPQESIYVSNENPKQGDTVFIRVKSSLGNVTGNFENEKLVFFKEANLPEWIAFLGIDVDQQPGDYKILVNTSEKQQLTKEIKVDLADFSSKAAIPAPNLQKKGFTNEIAIDNITKNDNPAIKKFLSNLTPEPYFTKPFTFPLSIVKRNGFSFGQFLGFGKYVLQHLGVDLMASERTNIYAVNDGKVVATLNLSNYGKTVIIDHGLDIFSLYLHLDQFKVSAGQIVSRGQVIGLSGNTGYTTGPHLHFSMRVDGVRVDPIIFIKTTQEMTDNPNFADISNGFLNILNKK